MVAAFSPPLISDLSVSAAAARVDVLQVKGVINPVMAGYVERGIRQSETGGATMVVIEMDTPGGLDTSMRDIVKSIVNARLPVVVYVFPPGGRAASAGTFITMAAHIAAMAPNTTIGAAHPVAISPTGEPANLPEGMKEKVVNDAVAYIKSLAARHGRNVEWAEQAVRQGEAATETKALELQVVDFIAVNLADLLSQLEGKQVTLLNGETVTLLTQDARVNYVPMTFIEKFLFTISDPNIAYILLSLAMLALIFELSNPGAIFPGVVGGISLLLALYSLGTLDAYWGGILLIGLAFALFVADLFVTSHGLLTAGGIASMVMGSLLLFSGKSVLFQIDPWVITGVVLVISGFFVFVVSAVIRAHRRRAATGREGLVGKTAIAQMTLNPTGTVFLEGERWTAVAEDGRIEPGEEVVVSKVEGLRLRVRRRNPAR
jgi:membrane-bound serine protease (ClpP class)